MKKLFFLLLISTATLITSCSITKPNGFSNNEIGTKEGVSRATFVLGIPIDGGDYSVRTAARNAKITKIACVDKRIKNYLLVYIVETIVTGE